MALRHAFGAGRLCGTSLLSCRAAALSPAQRMVPWRAWATCTSYSSASAGGTETVDLVYDLHNPTKPVADEKTQPILFLHGLFGSKKNNRSISRALARDLGRSVYALDLRNHGDSPHTPRHDYCAMADDVANFIQEHGLKEPSIIGHSMGAKTAMTLALKSPELVTSIIAVDNAPVDAAIGSDFAKYVRGMKEVDRKQVSRHSDAEKLLEPYESSLRIRQFLLGNMEHVDAPEKTSSDGARSSERTILQFRIPLDIISRSLDNLGDFPYKDPRTVRFEKPALFIRGLKSKYVPDEIIPLIGQFFPLFELVSIDAGHWLISEKPEEFRQAVVRFLSPKD